MAGNWRITMRFIKVSQKENKDIQALYESVMSAACYGLFYREGLIIGEEIARIAAQESEEDYFESCAKLLKAKGWVEEVKFEDTVAYVTASFESLDTKDSDKSTCHMLRGIMNKVYEGYSHKRMHTEEVECTSRSNDQCVFKVEEGGGD